MRRIALAATLGIAAHSLAGCRSQQAEKENVDQLTAQMLDVQAQYRKACDTPSDAVSKAIMRDAMGNGTPAEHKAHADQAKAEEAARHASPTCRTLEAQSAAFGQKLNAAMKTGTTR